MTFKEAPPNRAKIGMFAFGTIHQHCDAVGAAPPAPLIAVDRRSCQGAACGYCAEQGGSHAGRDPFHRGDFCSDNFWLL